MKTWSAKVKDEYTIKVVLKIRKDIMKNKPVLWITNLELFPKDFHLFSLKISKVKRKIQSKNKERRDNWNEINKMLFNPNINQLKKEKLV